MKRVTILFLLIPILAAGCSKKKKKDKIVFLPAPPSLSLTIPNLVFDPKLASGVTTEIKYKANPFGSSYDVTIKVIDNGSGIEVRRLVDGVSSAGGSTIPAAWDGKNDSGNFVDPGTYKITAEAPMPSKPTLTAEGYIYIVRLGVAGIQFVDGPVGSEYQMMYHIRNTTKYSYYAIPDNQPEWKLGMNSGDVADLDMNDGTARPLPGPWGNLNSPPQDATDPASVEDDVYNFPVCYKRGSTPKFILTMGTNAASNVSPVAAVGCAYPVATHLIRIVATGATPETPGSNEGITPGQAVTFVTNGTLPNAVQKGTLSPTFKFEYKAGGSWHSIPGQIDTSHTVYTIHDQPMLTESATPTAPYLPWVRVVDMVVGWVNGPSTADQITGIITDKVNVSFGLQYDTTSGAPSYMTGTLASMQMEMSDFIDDYDTASFGRVNCSDCADLVSTFANTVGIDHQYQIIGYTTGSIPLNYMIPLGWDWLIPFSGSFSFHAIVTPDSGVRVSDATARLDSDGDAGPSSGPAHTPLLPVNLDFTYYNQLLSTNPANYGTYTINRCTQR